jgi:hypothetical protein
MRLRPVLCADLPQRIRLLPHEVADQGQPSLWCALAPPIAWERSRWVTLKDAYAQVLGAVWDERLVDASDRRLS